MSNDAGGVESCIGSVGQWLRVNQREGDVLSTLRRKKVVVR